MTLHQSKKMASSSAKPTIILLPGGWHSPAVYDQLITLLSPHGYKCIALPLQAVTQEPAVKSLEPDITALRAAVEKEINENNDVMVMCHSFSGMVVSCGLSGLGKTEQIKQGKIAGVIRLAFISSFFPTIHPYLPTAFGDQIPDYYAPKGDIFVVFPDRAVDVFYNDIPQDEAAKWASQLRGLSCAIDFSSLKSEAWKEIPCSYLLCEEDNAVSVKVQETIIQDCLDSGVVIEVTRLKSGHSPFLSKPGEVASWLRRAAGEQG